MEIDVAIWLSVLVLVLIGWVFVASDWGIVEKIDEDGFTVRTILGTRKLILWESVEAHVQEFTSFLPRFVVRLRDRHRFVRLHTSFAVLLRNRLIDQVFGNEIRRRFTVLQLERLQDLWRR